MPVTTEELTDFSRFAAAKLSNGGADSLHELVDAWIAEREHDESVAAIRESIAQHEAGESLPLDEAFKEVRSKLGWSQ